MSIQWNPEGFRRLSREIEAKLRRDIAPRVKREQVRPLIEELNRLSRTHRGSDPTEIRVAVIAAFRRHGLEPKEIDPLLKAIQQGNEIPDIPVRVAPVQIEPPS
jgi:hypothetical protein